MTDNTWRRLWIWFPILVQLTTLIFAAGLLYQKVDSMDIRLKRMEQIFDSVTIHNIGGEKK